MRFLKKFNESYTKECNEYFKTYEDFNPSTKKEVEDYVDELIEKDYGKLLKILNIKTPDREIDVDELKQQAVEYFTEVPDRMNKTILSFNSIPVKANVIPKLTNIGYCLRESIKSDSNYIKMMLIDLTEDYQYKFRVMGAWDIIYIDILSPLKWKIPNIDWGIIKSKMEQILNQLNDRYEISEISIDVVGGYRRRRFKTLEEVKLEDGEEINMAFIELSKLKED